MGTNTWTTFFVACLSLFGYSRTGTTLICWCWTVARSISSLCSHITRHITRWPWEPARPTPVHWKHNVFMYKPCVRLSDCRLPECSNSMWKRVWSRQLASRNTNNKAPCTSKFDQVCLYHPQLLVFVIFESFVFTTTLLCFRWTAVRLVIVQTVSVNKRRWTACKRHVYHFILKRHKWSWETSMITHLYNIVPYKLVFPLSRQDNDAPSNWCSEQYNF